MASRGDGRRPGSSASRRACRLDRRAGARPRARDDDTDDRRSGHRDRPRPTTRPACVPPVADGRRARRARRRRPRPGRTTSSGGHELARRAPIAPAPPTPMTYGRLPGRPQLGATRRDDASRPLARDRPSRAGGRWPRAARRARDARTGRSSRRAGQHEMDVEPGRRPGGGRQPAVVGPAPAARDERVGAIGQRRADQELEVPQLVAAERERQQVLALDPDSTRPPSAVAEARQAAGAATAGRTARKRGGSRADRDRYARLSIGVAMATRITPADALDDVGQHAGMERSIAISAPRSAPAACTRRSSRPRPATRPASTTTATCETSIYIISGRRATPGARPGSSTTFDAEAGDFIYIPAGEIHVEENASATEPLVVVLTRNCPDSHVVYVDGGPTASTTCRRRADMTGWPDRPLAELLAEHGLTAPPSGRFPTDGWSGATFTTLDARRRPAVRPQARRRSALDWIARATDDDGLREALARAGRRGRRPGARRSTSPYLGRGRRRRGRGHPHARPDRPSSSPGSGRSTSPVVDDAVLDGRPGALARLHTSAWSECSVRRRTLAVVPARPRLRLLTRRRRRATRPTATRSASGSSPAGTAFDRRRRAPRGPGRSARRRPGAARRALATLPGRGLHGDLKLANVALLDDDAVGLHRLADDAARARRGRARLVPRLQQRLAADAARRRAGALPDVDGWHAAAGAGAAHDAEDCRRLGRPGRPRPGSSGCCCAAGARASTRRRPGAGVRAYRPPTTWRGGAPARSRPPSAGWPRRRSISGRRGEVAAREDDERVGHGDRDDRAEDREDRVPPGSPSRAACASR